MAIEIYTQCSNQYIMGPVGPVELDMKSVFVVMESMGIESGERIDLWERIKIVSHHLLKLCREDAKKKAKAKEGQQRGY